MGRIIGLTARNARQRPFAPQRGALSRRSALTPRECQVLDLLASGRTNDELAKTLGVSPNTVKTHLASLFAKLDVDRRVKAIEKARFLSLIE